MVSLLQGCSMSMGLVMIASDSEFEPADSAAWLCHALECAAHLGGGRLPFGLTLVCVSEHN
jgi:hypothetical protein